MYGELCSDCSDKCPYMSHGKSWDAVSHPPSSVGGGSSFDSSGRAGDPGVVPSFLAPCSVGLLNVNRGYPAGRSTTFPTGGKGMVNDGSSSIKASSANGASSTMASAPGLLWSACILVVCDLVTLSVRASSSCGSDD